MPNLKLCAGVGVGPFFNCDVWCCGYAFKSAYPTKPSDGSFIVSHPITHSSNRSPASLILSASAANAPM